MREAPTVSSWSRYAARTEGLIRKTTWLRMVETVENKTVRVYCFWAVRANQASSWSAPRTRSRVPRTITEIGLFSTKRANTLPSMVASSRESVSKAWSVTKREREDHLNRAGTKADRQRRTAHHSPCDDQERLGPRSEIDLQEHQ